WGERSQAVVAAPWPGLRLVPPTSQRPVPGAAARFALGLLAQSVVAAIDVARRAFIRGPPLGTVALVDCAAGGSTMPRREILDRIEKFIDPMRVTKGDRFRLKDIDPRDTPGPKMKKGEAADLLRRGREWPAPRA